MRDWGYPLLQYFLVGFVRISEATLFGSRGSRPLESLVSCAPATVTVVIDRVAGAIIRLVASVRLSVGALLFEPFDL